MLELGNDDTRDDHADPHHHTSPDKHGLATKLVDDGHGGNCRDEEYNTSYTGCKKSLRATCQAETDEHIACVVDDRIDTRPLSSR